ncbi:MAG: TonB-dependent receptor [Pseudomonadota bacterium]
MTTFRYRLPTVIASLLAGSAFAHDSRHSELEEIIVYGRAASQIGNAWSASEGLVGYDDMRLTPLLRVGELSEVAPGVVATQHSGTGKANQFFLRGFNLDHGTDFSAHLDGIPLNMRTHGHGQGYLDLNFIISELVATTRYRKGPYDAEVGDFSTAGSIEFSIYDRLPESVVQLTYGENDYVRTLFAGSTDWAGGTITGALDYTGYDGPWELPEDLDQKKLYAAYTQENGGLKTRYTASFYDSGWTSTDQIPERAVASGLISRVGNLDPSLGGDTRRIALTVSWESDTWEAGVYAVDYDFTLFSNFTYFLGEPDRGDEFEQRDSRRMYGGHFHRDQPEWRFAGRRAAWRWGADFRYDNIGELGLYQTQDRARFNTLRSDAVEEASLSAFVEADVWLTEKLRGSLGVRGEYFDWDVSAGIAENSGSDSETLVTPKLRLAYRVTDSVEAYASYGRGMHSNDVRGTVIRVDPATGDPADTVPALVASRGAELGLRYERGETANFSIVAFWVELDSELVFVGDAGGTEPNAGSKRTGIEATAFWRVQPWLALNSSYTYTDSRFDDVPADERRIPGALGETFTLGADAQWDNGWSGNIRLRHLGEAPLVEDASVFADTSTLVNASIAYRRGKMEYRLDGFNLLDSEDADIVYFYESRLPGEPVGGVADRHFHPLEPRTTRFTVTWRW